MIYGTGDEIAFLRELFQRNKVAFSRYANLVLTGRRSYDGKDMSVNIRRVRNEIKALLESTAPATKKEETIQ